MTTSASEAPPAAGRVSLLLVDDKPESLLALEALLEGLGQHLVKASSGKDALREVLHNDFAAILLDVQMPEMDGFETAALIRERERSRNTPILFLTAAHKSDAYMFKGYAAGAVDYILKPIIPEVLLSKVSVFVELAKKTAALQAMNETLNRQAAELAAANKDLAAFSYSVSHDLQSPLKSVEGFVHLLLSRHAASLDGEAKGFLERTLGAAQRMSRLVADLLKLSRMTTRELESREMDLSAMARSVFKELQRAEPGRRVSVSVMDGVSARGDPGLILVLLQNLLGNAWKFTSLRESAAIEFGSRPTDGSRTYFVRDDGCGFDPASAGEIFTPFRRLHRPDQYPGTGIGLATAQRIVLRHGGRIWAEGAKGQGATVYFTL